MREEHAESRSRPGTGGTVVKTLRSAAPLMPKQHKENDDRNRYAQQPKKNSSTHRNLLCRLATCGEGQGSSHEVSSVFAARRSLTR